MEQGEKVCFVIAPIGQDESPERKHSNKVLDEIIKPATQKCGYQAVRADKIEKPGQITLDIIWQVAHSPLVIADLTGKNANVFYELALRHTLRKPVITIMAEGQLPPFDTYDTRTIFFDVNSDNSIKNCCETIINYIQKIEAATEAFDNPISTAIDLQTLRRNEKFTLPDIEEALRKIRDLEDDVKPDHVRLFSERLKAQGIETKGELLILLSKEILDNLRTLYREELLRPADKLLDPEGIAVWGGHLLIYGTEANIISDIRGELHKSYEYGIKHGGLYIINAQWGASETWENVTNVLKARVLDNHLKLQVGRDVFGDPLYGTKKRLKVDYSYEGQDYSKEVLEDEVLELP